VLSIATTQVEEQDPMDQAHPTTFLESELEYERFQKSLASPIRSSRQPQNLGEILELVGTRQTNSSAGGSSPHGHGSSRSVMSAGSRVSFAKELEEVVDIPEYDNESRSKCFYSNRDLSEFRCEYEMEQDGLMPMQR
jgi:hypothetical protein